MSKRLGIILVVLLVLVVLIASSLAIASPRPTKVYFVEPLNIAHRGASGLVPENTLIAFDRAMELGADVLEFDVHSTIDNRIVVIHDETVGWTAPL